MGPIGCVETSERYYHYLLEITQKSPVLVYFAVEACIHSLSFICSYRGANKSLVRPGRKQARNHVRDARDFNNIETRAVINFFFLQGKAPKEIQAILTETLPRFLPGRAKDLSSPLNINSSATNAIITSCTNSPSHVFIHNNFISVKY